jgi:hypothetical protein
MYITVKRMPEYLRMAGIQIFSESYITHVARTWARMSTSNRSRFELQYNEVEVLDTDALVVISSTIVMRLTEPYSVSITATHSGCKGPRIHILGSLAPMSVKFPRNDHRKQLNTVSGEK